MKMKDVKTKEEARAYAIEWQAWQSERDLSFADMIKWHRYFLSLATKFDLTEEFTENGII